ncbi:MAG: hypothetical protein HY784_17570 [Chloroflexi bacterium]|nr:hypothetical protein [Chloroflexota bacterium]
MEPSPSRPPGYRTLWLVVIASLALNLYLLRSLLHFQSQLGAAAGQLSLALAEAGGALDSLKSGTISYTVRLDQQVPIRFDVPVDQQLTVPISTTVPIRTVVNVPLPGALGVFPPLQVPISQTLPVAFSAVIPIHLTVPISQTIPLKLEVPVDIPLSDTPLAGLAELLEQFLSRVQQQLGGATP